MEIINSDIQNYAEKYTSGESEILSELREKTEATRADKMMLSGFYQGRLLAMFSQMIRPRRILEIGTFMGYSALCLAEGLTDDGKLITLDIEPATVVDIDGEVVTSGGRIELAADRARFALVAGP